MRSIKEESQAELQRLSDNLRRHREQLRSLKRPVNQWDDWFVSIASDYMDRVTRRDWEEELQRLSPERTAHHSFHSSNNWTHFYKDDAEP